MAENNRRTFLSPGTLKGFMSAVAPLAVGNGYAAAIYDTRLDQGVPSVRWGSLLINGAVNGTQTFRGCFECNQNGTQCIFVATSDGSNHVSILKSTNGGTSFSSITPNAGTYGDTRFTDVGPIYFALVNESGVDYLVAQNGVDGARVYNGTTMAVSAAITLVPNSTLSAGFVSTLLWSAVDTAVVDSDSTKMDGSIVTDALGTHAEVIVKTTVTTSPVVTSTFNSTGPALLNTPGYNGQFVWLVDGADQIWRSLKIEVQTQDATWYSLYDPTTDSAVTADTTSGTTVLAGVYTLSRSPDTTQPLKSIQAFRITWVGASAPAANTTVKIYTLAAGGYRAGGTNYADGFASGGTRASGTSNILTNPTVPVISGVTIPISQQFGYVYTIDTTVPSSLPAGVDTLNYYRNDIGTTGYYYFGTDAIAASSTEQITDGAVPDFSGGATIDYSRQLPPAGTTSLPIGTCMGVVNDRLFVGSGSRLWYSEAGSPFLFSQTVRFSGTEPVSTSGGSFTKAGETFNAIVAVGQVMTGSESLGTPQQGAVTTYVMTDRTTYVLSGFDALSLNKTVPVCEGTMAPFSPSQTNSGFFFLDSKYQIRYVEGTDSKAVSKYVVDDQFRGIPSARLKYVWGAVIDERYYMAYTPSGGTANTRVVVYNQSLGFESIDRPIQNAQGLLPYYDSTLSRTRLYAFSQTTLFEHAAYSQTTDIGSVRPTMTLTFGEWNYGVPSVNVANGFFLSDVDASGAATMTIINSTGNRAGTVTYTAVSLAGDGSDTKVGKSFAPGQGASTLSFQPSLSIQALGGTRLYRYEVEVGQGPDSFRR